MLKIVHRVNTLEALRAVPPHFGVEMDIHSYGDRLVVHHDPCARGVNLEAWLEAYRHRFVIFNIKEEGIEGQVTALALDYGIVDYFMLDLTFPALVKQTRIGETRIAVRISEYEPIEGALSLAGKTDWVWLDIFDGFWLTASEYQSLSAKGFKICLVSPELQGRSSKEIGQIKSLIMAESIQIDAVCTKFPDTW